MEPTYIMFDVLQGSCKKCETDIKAEIKIRASKKLSRDLILNCECPVCKNNIPLKWKKSINNKGEVK